MCVSLPFWCMATTCSCSRCVRSGSGSGEEEVAEVSGPSRSGPGMVSGMTVQPTGSTRSSTS